MRTRSYGHVAGAAALIVGLGLLTGGGTAADAKSATVVYKPVVPTDVVGQLIGEEAKALQGAVAKASDKKMATKARSIAFLIAVYSQDESLRSGPNAAAMAGLRDTALKLAKAVGDGKVDDAKKLAAEIKPTGSPDANAKAGPVAIQNDFEIDTLMQAFKPDRSGGLELEKKLNMMKDKRGSSYTPAEYKQIVLLMYRIAAIAQPTEAMAPAPMGKKNPADWIKLAQDMGTEAVAAADLAKMPKPDFKAVKAAVTKVEGTCASCHEKFRD
jgi:hypothetical protein